MLCHSSANKRAARPVTRPIPLPPSALIGYCAAMIVIFALIVGAAYGWMRAGKLEGNRADRLQYAAGYGLAFTVIGLILTVVLSRLL
ncbi:hypothetical protein [Paracoccus sp. (in: a-proteobacteria)]|uniref:hypothetical protein n=1 Tax=Paracoccus sp. TaxID=267 RepID=UPI0028A210FA|nr:hypothetical protein [Paracoccus sp. (in: a-proteobacteria)]